MDFSNMTNQQLQEQITLYESKIKSWKEKIRAELKIRQNLKEKLNEAKKREATQILILERLDEYEEVVTKQLELVEKMEDSESVKQLAVIAKYESMLREQKEIWSVYEKEYEELPLAKERREAEIRLMKIKIQNNLVLYKLKEIDKINKMKEKIQKRQEQLQIIEMAKLYVDQKKKEKYCLELLEKIKKKRFEEQKLKQQIKDAEKQIEEKKKLKYSVNKSIKPQQLPKIDLSRYIIPKKNYNYDTVSMNSYILEQEYMNIEDLASQPSQSTKQIINTDAQSQNTINETMEIDSEPMDLDDEEKTMEQKRTNDSKMDVDETQITNNSGIFLKQSNKVKSDKKNNSNSITCQKLSQESQSEAQKTENRVTPHKRPSQQQSSQEDVQSKGFVKVSEQRMNYSSPYRTHERPIPSPAKLQRQVSEAPIKQYENQQKQQQQQEQSFLRNNANTVFANSKDSIRSPQTNQPLVGSNNTVEYLTNQFQEIIHTEQVSKVQSPSIKNSNEDPQNTSSSINNKKSSLQSPVPRQNSIFMDREQDQQEKQEVMNTPILNIINPSITPASMLNMAMGSGEMNMFSDSISAILGSDITEPGGSIELARRLHEDSDVVSEASDVYYEKMMENCLSPILSHHKMQQEQQQQAEISSQKSENNLNSSNNTSQPRPQEQNEINFSLTGFAKKPMRNFF